MENRSVGIVEQKIYHCENAFRLSCGAEFSPLDIAYETYGKLNEKKDNAILILHALTGDSHAAGYHEGDDKPGWWEDMIGPGRPFDTDRYFIICSNIFGSCYGTTGPSSVNPKTNKPYALDFPVFTVKDMVRVQNLLIEHLKIDKLLAVAGGSLGGMQALEWAVTFPDKVRSAISIASTPKMSPQNMAFHETGRFAILSDPNFNGGNYYDQEKSPDKGLSLARMIGHITYLSEESMNKKFGRELTSGHYMFNVNHIEFQVQSYLHYQGSKFVERFDANSYLYLTKAMDYFDISKELEQLKSDTRFLVITFSSDWLFPLNQSLNMVTSLRNNKNKVSYISLDAKEGHDSFLLNFEDQSKVVSNFLKGVESAG